MIQHLIVLILFIGALAYVGRLVYQSFQTKSCSSGCGSCGIDFKKIEQHLAKKKAEG